MYQYHQIKELKSKHKNIFKMEILIPLSKWKELLINQYLRFFKHKKYILHFLNEEDKYIINICKWEDIILLNDYNLSKKYKHLNIIDHLCYFEYEEDIINFLCNSNNENQLEDINEFNAVLITNKYDNFDKEHLVHLNQVFMILFFLFFKHNAGFIEIDIRDILIKKQTKNKTLIYNINNKKYKIRTDTIIKINNNVNLIENCYNISILYNSINKLLHQIHYEYFVDVSVAQKTLFSSSCSIENIICYFHSF